MLPLKFESRQVSVGDIATVSCTAELLVVGSLCKAIQLEPLEIACYLRPSPT